MGIFNIFGKKKVEQKEEVVENKVEKKDDLCCEGE